MKKTISICVLLILVVSCTSKTIYPKPKDLIPKDTMSLLFKDLFIANAARNVKNIKLQRKVNYHPLIFKKYKIDSSRFYRSNLYYTSTIDGYEDIFAKTVLSIENDQKIFIALKKRKDSIIKDSINKRNEFLKKQRQQNTLEVDKVKKKKVLSNKRSI